MSAAGYVQGHPWLHIVLVHLFNKSLVCGSVEAIDSKVFFFLHMLLKGEIFLVVIEYHFMVVSDVGGLGVDV